MMINSISIALTGLDSASKRLNASAANIANLQTAGSLADGAQPPYTPLETRQTAITADNTPAGVRTDYAPRANPFVPAYDPNSPFADENGIIGVPNIDLASEIVNINLAEIAYKANASVLRTADELSDELFRIFDKKV